MQLKHIIIGALNNLSTHKGRSLLTVLGIVIGVSALIIIMSAGNGATQVITGEIASLGADIIWIEPGREPEGPSGLATIALTNSITQRDVDALMRPENVPGLKAIVPSRNVSGSVSYSSETYRPMIIGFSAEFLGDVFDLYAEEGVFFDEVAIRNEERVAVIGAKVREELFGGDAAVGKVMKINGKSFRIVGVLPDKGQVLFFDVGELVVVPYTTARTYLAATAYYNEVWVQAADVSRINETVRDIKLTLRELHGITNPDKDDFHVMTQESLLGQVSSIIDILTVAVAAIAAIALVVGGVGIMNIMLVSVTERTREIGLRKAIGATGGDILKQFMIEAIMLTGAGGVLGALFGMLIAYLLSVVLSAQLGVVWGTGIELANIGIGVGVSVAVGLVFGVVPALRASQKQPIEALRYE